jgi:hypothetical protein
MYGVSYPSVRKGALIKKGIWFLGLVELNLFTYQLRFCTFVWVSLKKIEKNWKKLKKIEKLKKKNLPGVNAMIMIIYIFPAKKIGLFHESHFRSIFG